MDPFALIVMAIPIILSALALFAGMTYILFPKPVADYENIWYRIRYKLSIIQPPVKNPYLSKHYKIWVRLLGVIYVAAGIYGIIFTINYFSQLL